MILRILIIFFLSQQFLISQTDPSLVCPLKVGSEVPEVIIYDQDNNEIQLKELASDTASVIIFYRGAWCGYCTKHLGELNDIKGEIESLGYQIFGITIDQTSKLEESNNKAESEIKVYSDANTNAIQAFGLDWNVNDELFAKYKNEYKLDLEEWSGQNHHTLPVPAIYIIKDNIVKFQYANPNHNTRLKAETLLAMLKTI